MLPVAGLAKKGLHLEILIFTVRNQFRLPANFLVSNAGANMVSMSASQLIRLFDHIYNTSEVLLMASPDEFTLRSFRNMDSFNRNYENVSLSGGLTTEMKLKPEDFNHYSFQGEEEVGVLISNLKMRLVCSAHPCFRRLLSGKLR